MGKKTKDFCIGMREHILLFKKDGKSLSSIAEIVGHAKSTVQPVIKNFSKSQSLLSKQKTGRLPKISPRNERFLKSVVNKNP